MTPAQVEAKIAGYRGQRGLPEPVLVFVRDVVRDAVRIDPAHATAAWVAGSLSILAAFVDAAYGAGLPLDRSALFTQRRVTNFTSHDRKGNADGGKASYRSRLNVITDALTVRPIVVSNQVGIVADDVTRPYTRQQLQALHGWVFTVWPDTRRHRVETITVLGLGCGLRRQDLLAVHGTDVTRDSDGVHVHVPVPTVTCPAGRTVTVLAAYEDRVWTYAQTAEANLLIEPAQPALGKQTFDKVVGWANQQAPVPFNVRRLRNTWLTWHLTAGTPLPILMPAAGLTTTEHLKDLLDLLPAPPVTDRVRHLRGPSR